MTLTPPTRTRFLFSFALLALCVTSLMLPVVQAADEVAFTREHGYIEMKDGVRLKYTVLLPPGAGPWPVLFQYEGYNAGSFPDRGFEQYKHELLADGYAIFGVSLRGTACSGGVFDLFSREWAEDGAAAVEWAAVQPWSNGRIGMFSLSFAGIMQLWVAAEQPPHLVSIAPGQVVVDTYRDVGYPGGIPNNTFPPLWMAAMQLDWAEAGQLAMSDGDAECGVNLASHNALNLPDNFIVNGFMHQTDDDWHEQRSMRNRLGLIEVPVLGMQSWQDEQTGPRGGHHFDYLNPETSWIVSVNGQHGMYTQSPRFLALLHDWFDYTLKGTDNGFEDIPRVQLWHEMDAVTRNPTWVTTAARWPMPRRPLKLKLRAGGQLSPQPAAPGESPDSFVYPVPGPSGGYETVSGGWNRTPAVMAGSAAYTTGAMPEDLSFAGEASADLWVSATAPDADLQVTLTEVRPDGQEVYVQRGWLRLSHRALDEQKSTVLRPVHPHTAGNVADLPLNEPVLARVEVLPFAHTFRRGSALRLWIDTPSLTGLWDFLISPVPAQISIHHDPDHPSQLVLGYIDAGPAPVPLPACRSLAGQDCRADTRGIPAIDGPRASDAGDSDTGTGGGSQSLARRRSGGGGALGGASLTLLFLLVLMRRSPK